MLFFRPNPRKELDKTEKGVDLFKRIIFLKHPALENGIGEETRNAFYEMEKKYLKLRERYKYDIKKLLPITLDWFNYAASLSKLVTAFLLLDADLKEGANERYDERVKKPRIIIEEIEKRVDELLKKS